MEKIKEFPSDYEKFCHLRDNLNFNDSRENTYLKYWLYYDELHNADNCKYTMTNINRPKNFKLTIK